MVLTTFATGSRVIRKVVIPNSATLIANSSNRNCVGSQTKICTQTQLGNGQAKHCTDDDVCLDCAIGSHSGGRVKVSMPRAVKREPLDQQIMS